MGPDSWRHLFYLPSSRGFPFTARDSGSSSLLADLLLIIGLLFVRPFWSHPPSAIVDMPPLWSFSALRHCCCDLKKPLPLTVNFYML